MDQYQTVLKQNMTKFLKTPLLTFIACDIIQYEICVWLVQAWLCPFPISWACTSLFTMGTECEAEGASTVQSLFSFSVLPTMFWSQHCVS